MKKPLSIVLSLAMLVLFALGLRGSVLASAPIEVDRPSSLTVQYKMGDELFRGLEIKTYRIAQVFADGTYELCPPFESLPVDIYGITSQTQWKRISETLASYAVADAIEPTVSALTDEEGRVHFENILPGMYLTLGVTHSGEKGVSIFESFISAVPYPDENGNHNYSPSVFPKCESFVPAPDEVEFKVVKQWQDMGYEEKRPDAVTVDIYKNGELYSSQSLTSENDWCYSWKALDDGSQWVCVERDVPEDYTVTVVEKDRAFVITNATDTPEGDAPQTGEFESYLPYAIALGIAGGVLLLVAVIPKRKESNGK